MTLPSAIPILTGLLLAPLLLGVIRRTKAAFAGRHGPPFLQAYYDLIRLLRKGAVYSRHASWVFHLAPAISLATMLAALTLLPAAGAGALFAFPGDLILFAYCFGLQRFFMVAAALDTGSSFGGMGASRDVQIAALAEPALILSLASLVRISGSLSFSGMFQVANEATWPATVLIGAALVIVFLAENARIPVDDPATHLELTMIHEVMLLEYSGPDLAMVQYGAALKLWVLGAWIVNLGMGYLPFSGLPAMAAFLAGMLLLAVAVGVIESIMARLSLLRVPQLLIGAAALALLAFLLALRFAV